MSLASKGTPVDMQSAATATGNGTVVTAPVSAFYHTFLLKGTGTISSGVVTIEEADSESYSGTWSSIQAVNGTDITGGAIKGVHVSGFLRAIRARISTTIGGGGSVSVSYVGN